MSVEFRVDSRGLILEYRPDFGEWLSKKLNSGGYTIGKCFFVDKTKLVNDSNKYYDDTTAAAADDVYTFRIGTIEGDYIKLDKEVFSTGHQFFVYKNIKFDRRFLSTMYGIATILK